MTTLSEFKKLIADSNIETKTKAAVDLANYFLVYNEEYNVLQDKLVEATAEHYAATHSKTGVNQGYRIRLEAFMFDIRSRMAMLDLRMRAFYHDEIDVVGPDPAAVAKIKELTDQVAKMKTRDDAIDNIVKGLTSIAELANQGISTVSTAVE